MNSITKKLSIIIVLVSIIFTPQVVLALAQSEPSFFILIQPKIGDVEAGSYTTFELDIIPQDGFEGNVHLTFMNASVVGLTATIEPDTVFIESYGSNKSILTINVDSIVSKGEMNLVIIGTDVEGKANSRRVYFTLLINDIIESGSPPVSSGPPPSDDVPPGQMVTTTVTSTFTTTLSTATTTTTIISTVTQVITTNTSPVATKTTVTEFDQVAELIYPIGTLVIVIILIGVAVIMLRKPKKINQ